MYRDRKQISSCQGIGFGRNEGGWLPKGTECLLEVIKCSKTDCSDSCTTCCCSVTKSCLTFCSALDCNTPGFSVLHYLPELAQTHAR